MPQQVILKGLDDMQAAFKAIGSIPLTVTKRAVSAMGAVAASSIKTEGEAMGVRDPESGEHILDHISVSKPIKRDDGVKAFVTFTGTRQRGNTKTRNAEIAYINEYGAPRRGIPARPFISTGMARHEDEISAPADEIIGGWIEQTYSK